METRESICGTKLGAQRCGGVRAHTRPAAASDNEPRTPERTRREYLVWTSPSSPFGGVDTCACGYSSSKQWHVTRHRKSCASAGAGSSTEESRASSSKKDVQTQTLPDMGTCEPHLGAVACPMEDGHTFSCPDDLKRHFFDAHPAFLEFLRELLFPEKDTQAADMGLA
jgi:hypothetical protein